MRKHSCLISFYHKFELWIPKNFPYLNPELFILEENFCPLKFRSHQDASFPFIGKSLRIFLAELSRKNRLKMSNLEKSTKPLEILT